MNDHNWKRSRTQIADDLEACLVHGHDRSPIWPHACQRRCMVSDIRPDYDPATPENIARIREQAKIERPPFGWALTQGEQK